MSWRRLCAVGLGAVASLSGCSADTVEAARGPLALLTPAVHDAGIIPFGSSIEHRFRLLNTTSEEIVVDILKTSCGCTEAKVVPDRIPPGAEAEVLVEFEAESPFGKDVRILLASSHFPDRLLADLHVVARVDGSDRILVEPKDMHLEGTSSEGVAGDTFLVRCLFRDSETPTLEIEAPEWAETEIRSTLTKDLGGGLMERRFTVGVRADVSDKGPGDYAGELLFSTSLESIAVARATILATVRGAYRAEPESIFLGSGIGGAVTHYLDLFALQPGFDVESATCDDERFALAWVDPADGRGQRRLRVTFDPDVGTAVENDSRLVEAQVSLTFRPETAPLVVPVTGWLDLP